MSSRVPAKAPRRIWPIAVFTGSAILSLVVGSVLLASHTPFQANPDGLSYLARQVGTARGTWQAIHLLSTTCSCSRGVAEHLIKRGPMAQVNEHIVLAGSDAALANRLRLAGFPVEIMSPETVATHYHIAGAPWLVFVSPQGDVRYQGGYTPAHARNNYQDEQIWSDLRSGRTADSLPVLGCALGKRLQRTLDPLGLKYPN
jgi:hypothetical protein